MTHLGRCLLLLAFACSACAEPRQARPSAAGDSVLVMTYNLNFGLAGDPETVGAIRSSGADLIFLQETNEAWERALRHAAHGRYPHVLFKHCCRAGGLAVLSRYPFVETAYAHSPGGWFPSLRITATTPIGAIDVVQVHLQPPVSGSGSFVSGYFTTGDERFREMQHFSAGLDPRVPTLVLGDFNESSGPASRLLEANGMRDAVTEFDAGPTWRWQTSAGSLSRTLDRVFYSPSLTPLSVDVPESGRSDHLPVLVRFETAR